MYTGTNFVLFLLFLFIYYTIPFNSAPLFISIKKKRKPKGIYSNMITITQTVAADK